MHHALHCAPCMHLSVHVHPQGTQPIQPWEACLSGPKLYSRVLQLSLSNSRICHHPKGTLSVQTAASLKGLGFLCTVEAFSVRQVISGCLMHRTAQNSRFQWQTLEAWEHFAKMEPWTVSMWLSSYAEAVLPTLCTQGFSPGLPGSSLYVV